MKLGGAWKRVAKIYEVSHGDNFGYYKMEHFVPYPWDTHCASKFDFILKLCYTKMGWTKLLGSKKEKKFDTHCAQWIIAFWTQLSKSQLSSSHTITFIRQQHQCTSQIQYIHLKFGRNGKIWKSSSLPLSRAKVVVCYRISVLVRYCIITLVY